MILGGCLVVELPSMRMRNMHQKSRDVLCSMIGAILGAAVAISIPMWPVLYSDIGVQRPFWTAFGGFFTAAGSLDEYYTPLAITAGFIAVGQISARRIAKYLSRRAKDRRLMRGCCAACGYDLRGNTSGVCPECGEPARQASMEYDLVTANAEQEPN